jgi:hypothetical protein
MAATFPTSIPNPDYGLKEEIYLPTVRTEFEAGYVQSRRLANRPRRRYSMSWKSMPEAAFQALATFFLTYQGDEFTWTDPVTAVVRTLLFSEDQLDSTISRPGRRTVTLKLEEQ